MAVRRQVAGCIGAALLAFGLASGVRAQTYRVVPVVSGSAYANDINENGDICGQKPGALPGFVSIYRRSDGERILRETVKVPVAFSPGGAFMATKQGALIIFAQSVLDGSVAGMSTDLPPNFVPRSINDDGILVGNVPAPGAPAWLTGYSRNLWKTRSEWGGEGYACMLLSPGVGPKTARESDATCINANGMVGGYAAYSTNYQSGPEYPFITAHNSSWGAWPGTPATQVSLERGAIFDLNDYNVGAGYERANSDPTCIRPSILIPTPQGNATGERRFLGETPSSPYIIPNTEGRVVGLNDDNVGVGWSQVVGDSTKTKYACLFDAAGTRALNSLLEKRVTYVIHPNGMKTAVYWPSLWRVRADTPMDINNSGDICATAYYDSDPTPRAVLLKRL